MPVSVPNYANAYHFNCFSMRGRKVKTYMLETGKSQSLSISVTSSKNIADSVPYLSSKRNKAYKKGTTGLQPYSTDFSGNPGNASKLAKGYNTPSPVCTDLSELIVIFANNPVRFLRIIQETIVIPPRQSTGQNCGDTSPESRLPRVSAVLSFPDEYGSSIPAFPPKTDSRP